MIPFFPLPSRPHIAIQFNTPSVDTAMYFCKTQAFTEERDTSEYLNMLQTKETHQDSRNWTAQDRRSALWWIFINSNASPVLDFHYVCEHCGEDHWNNLNMHDLIGDLDVLAVDPFIQESVSVKGKPYEWLIKPLDGHAMERLERMRQMLPPRSKEVEFERAVTDLRLWEFVYQSHLFYDLEPDFDKSAQTRYELIRTMDVGTEFMELAYKVRSMQEELRHGIPVQLDKGEAYLLLPPHECQSETLKEPAQRPFTRLLVPFRDSQFIPAIGTGPLADLSVQPGLVWSAARH